MFQTDAKGGSKAGKERRVVRGLHAH